MDVNPKEEGNVKNIFVGNLTFQTTENDLGDLFKAFGQVTRVHVAIDRDTGKSRGFAFVEMPNDADAALTERMSAAAISR